MVDGIAKNNVAGIVDEQYEEDLVKEYNNKRVENYQKRKPTVSKRI